MQASTKESGSYGSREQLHPRDEWTKRTPLKGFVHFVHFFVAARAGHSVDKVHFVHFVRKRCLKAFVGYRGILARPIGQMLVVTKRPRERQLFLVGPESVPQRAER